MSLTKIPSRSSRPSKLLWSDLTFVSPGLSIWPWGSFLAELSSIDFGVKMDYWPLFNFALLASCASIFAHRDGRYYFGFRKDSYFSVRGCPYVCMVDDGSVMGSLFPSLSDDSSPELFYDIFIPLDKFLIWCLSDGCLLSSEFSISEAESFGKF